MLTIKDDLCLECFNWGLSNVGNRLGDAWEAINAVDVDYLHQKT